MIKHSFGFALSDENGRLTQVDRTVCELLGYEAAALLGRTLKALTHPDDWAACQGLMERLCAHDEPFSVANRYLRRDGTTVWAQAYLTRLTDAEGRATLSAMIRPVLPSPPPMLTPPQMIRPAMDRTLLAEPLRPAFRPVPGRTIN